MTLYLARLKTPVAVCVGFVLLGWWAVVNWSSEDMTIEETKEWIERCPEHFENVEGRRCHSVVWMASNWVNDDLYSADCIRKTLEASFSTPWDEYPLGEFGGRNSLVLFYDHFEVFCL